MFSKILAVIMITFMVIFITFVLTKVITLSVLITRDKYYKLRSKGELNGN